MRKYIKIFSIIFCMVLCIAIFSACDDTSSSDNSESLVPIPSEIKVEGYEKEVVVGESIFSTLLVDQKVSGEWKGVAKADYTCECDYDGTKYGEYSLKVYLNDYPHIKLEDTIKVSPLTVTIPSFNAVYDGDLVDIKSELETTLNGLYEVSTYTKVSKVGEYSANVKLTNPDKYTWVDASGNVVKGSTHTIKWNITKAPAKRYTGETNLTVYYGDTLTEVATENNLKNITFNVDASTRITNQESVVATYNESAGNYEDTIITIFFDEIITTANYKIEYYFFDGNDYVLDENKTETFSGNITEIVSVESGDFDGYELNTELSNLSGRIVKKDGLVLKLYYNLI